MKFILIYGIVEAMSVPEGVMLDCLPEEAEQFRMGRQEADAAVSTYQLPELPDDPSVIYEYLRVQERQCIPKDDYEAGSARKDDDLLIIRGNSGVLLTAEHATVQRRRQPDGTVAAKEEDSGTAALVVNALETFSDGIVAIGRQTGDANHDEHHPTKDHITKIIIQAEDMSHLSLHGMKRAHTSRPRDPRGFSAQLGLGNKPSEATLALKDLLVETGKQYDLRIGVNAPHIRFGSKTGKILLNEDGSIKTITFAAAGPNTTRAHSQAVAESLGRNDSFAAIQIELSDVLRSHPEALISFPSQRDRELGAYLGYLFIRGAVESAARLK